VAQVFKTLVIYQVAAEMVVEVTSYQLKLHQAKKDTGARGFLDTTTTALNLIGKGLFDVSGAGSRC
jgi:hypothetical protein